MAAGPMAISQAKVVKSDMQVVRDLEVLAPTSRTQLARPGLFLLALRKHNIVLLTLLYLTRSATKSWLALLKADLDALAGQSTQLEAMRTKTWPQ